MSEAWGGMAAFILAVVHLLAGRLRLLDVTPRSAWLSAAGGISVAYVFLHLLPELGEAQAAFEAAQPDRASVLGQEIYLAALLGLGVFYGLERMAATSRRRQHGRGDSGEAPAGVFALHVAGFSLYNALIGYLLVHGEQDNLPLYATAMGLHFLVNDHALRQHHRARYERLGRWLLAAAVLGGWALASAGEVPLLLVDFLIAFLAGGVIMNVMKEELPEERESRFTAFLGGAACYGALLLIL